jgi:hypothetical protein
VSNEYDECTSESTEEKSEIKKLSAHQRRDFKLQLSGMNRSRPLSASWFDMQGWLTVRKNILAQLIEGYHVSIQCQNELEDNRNILGRIINCIKFCGTHKLSGF